MKRPHTRIAEHLGWDVADVIDYNYQPGRFNTPVYSVGRELQFWAGTKPRDRDKIMLDWKPVVSSHDGSTLWLFESKPVPGEGGGA